MYIKEQAKMKKSFVFLFAMAMVLFVVGSVGAVPTSDTKMLADGYWEEVLYGGGEGQAGNQLFAYDSATFSYFEASLVLTGTPDLLEDTVDGSGNGIQVWKTLYTGGILSLSGQIWDSGDTNYYDATADSAWVVSTHVYENGQRINLESEIKIYGTYTDSLYSDVDLFITADAIFAGYATSWDNYDMLTGALTNVQLNPIPEPATMLLLGSGLIGFAGFRRKVKK